MIYYRYPSYRFPPPVIPNTQSQNSRLSYTNQHLKNQYSTYAKKQFQNEHQTQTIRETKKVLETKENSNKSDENALFEIFGIKLYFDDILLICLIFFLYNEGVQDQYLFITLILLLLS